MPTNELDRKAKLRYELARRGITQRSIADSLEVSEATVSKVLFGAYPDATEQGRRTADRVWARVSELTGLPREELTAVA